MPIVNVPDVGQVRFPDDMSDKEIVDAIQNHILKKPEPTVGEYIKDVPKALGRGVVGLLETAGIGASAALPEEYEQKARAGIQSLAAPAKEYLAPSTPEVGGSVSSKLLEGVGSTLPFFLMGPFGPVARVGAAGLGVAAGAGEARVGAEQAGATPEERAKATAFGAPTGLLDIIAPEVPVLSRFLRKELGPIQALMTTAAARGGVEGLTEAAQKVSQNLIAKGIYDPNQPILAGAGEEGAYGAGVGALASLLIDLTVGRKSYGVGAKPGAAAETPVAPLPEPPSVETLPALPAPEPTLALPAPAETPLLPAPTEPVPPSPIDIGRVPSMGGLPGANEEMMDALRERQAKEAKAERVRQQQEAAAEADRQRQEAEAQRAQMQAQEDELRDQIEKAEKTIFSPDPIQHRRIQDRVVGQLKADLGNLVARQRAIETAEPPKFEPITAPQEKPKGAQVFKFTPEEQEHINTLKTNLTEINSQIAEAKKQKTSLFSRLTGALASRPGAFSVKDIVSENKNLSKLFNKQGRGRLLEDMIADGSLDQFLPQTNQAIIDGDQNPNFDPQAALNHIADKLGSGDYRSTAEAEMLDYLTRQKDDIQKELDYVTSLPEVNAELARRAAAPKKAVEPVSIADLEGQAQQKGVDTEGIKHQLALQYPEASQEQFLGFYQQALTGATSTSPSYTIDGFQYTAEEIEDAISERLTDEEIDEYIAQAEAEQAAARPAPKQPAARRAPEPAPQRTPTVEPAPAVTGPEPGQAMIEIPKGAINPRLGDAIVANDWSTIANELGKSKNPIIARIGQLAKDLRGVNTEINAIPLGPNPRVYGGWSKLTNQIFMRSMQNASNESHVGHEVAHALTYYAIKNPRPDQKAAVARLRNLYRFTKSSFKKAGYTEKQIYGLTDEYEFIAEAYSNADFQKMLALLPYQKQTAWGAFTQAVADLLGIKNSNALTEVIALTEELANPQTRVSTKVEAKAEKPVAPVPPATKEKPPVLTAPAGFKLKKRRNEQVVLAARELAAGRITKQEYDKYVDYYMPIAPVPKPEAPLNEAGMRRVLKSNQVVKINPSIANGTPVGLRMDINALEKADQIREKTGEQINGSVVAIHPKNNPRSTIGYSGSAYITNAKFITRSEAAAMDVAMNLKDKSPQQTVEGNWVNKSNDEIYRMVQEKLNDPQWAQISLDPLRHSFFYDRATRQPVLSADEALQVGRFVLAKNPVYGKREDFLYVKGTPETKPVDVNSPAFKRWFGDSKVVDVDGTPLTMYTGTSKDKDFKKFNVPRNGTWFTMDPKDASMYAMENDSMGFKWEGGRPVEVNTAARVIPTYLRIENPYKVTEADNARMNKENYKRAQAAFFDELRSKGYDGVDMGGGVFVVLGSSNQIKSALGNVGTFEGPDILFLERTPEAEAAMDILDSIDRGPKKPEPGQFEKVRTSWNNAIDNPSLAKEQSLGAFRRFLDRIQTWAFSSDAALNNQIRREILESSLGEEEKIGILLNASLSQTAHSDAVAGLFLTEGNIRWNPELHKWEGVKDENNFLNLSRKMDEIAAKHGLTKEEVELIAHAAFEARRTQGLIQSNSRIEAQAEAMRAEAQRIRGSSPVAASELMDKANRLLQKKKFIHMTPAQIKGGMTQFEIFPELKEVADIWDGIRQNGIKVMVDTGLYTEEEADTLLANADYVPFFREDQIEEGKGPKEFLRSLSVQADKALKGSNKPVNDIFDNMVRWTQYAVNRGVRNRSALALVDTAQSVGLADAVPDAKAGDNVVRVWREGREQYYNMADPMFVEAFRGLESVAIPTIKVFSKFADILRNSVVLFPLFSVSQLSQDSFAAMFSSGLKPQHALTIPVRAVKEFIQTLRGKSSIHEELKNVGVVGVRDFSSAIIRSEAEILAGLKKDKSVWDKVKRSLGNVAMAADNAVRQATYEAALAQGMSRAEAIEKAFEIFNVRRRGNSKMLALAGQVIPFFNAYLAAQNVAYRTLTGAGTSPTERKAALQTLAATTGSVMVLSMLYAMMMAGDDDYEKKPTPTRDRLLMIPGTPFGLPLRADAFILPKVIAENTYHLITENGMTDPAKFRESMKSVLANSILSPTPVPQAIKPIAEGILNYDFFQQKPLVGIYQAKKDVSRQFEDSTSEFAKLIGKTELISPIVADHVIRGMFGSFGGLFLLMTNPLIAGMAGTTRPDMSLRDAANAIPNASAFISKEYEVGLRKDFYALKEVTDRAAATLSDMKNRSPQEIKEYLEDPVIRQRIGMAPVISRISNQLTEIRKKVNLITSVEDPNFSAPRKEEMIRQLREQEYQLLKNIDLRKLRAMAQM